MSQPRLMIPSMYEVSLAPSSLGGFNLVDSFFNSIIPCSGYHQSSSSVPVTDVKSTYKYTSTSSEALAQKGQKVS